MRRNEEKWGKLSKIQGEKGLFEEKRGKMWGKVRKVMRRNEESYEETWGK